jgi:hypothetical protein
MSDARVPGGADDLNFLRRVLRLRTRNFKSKCGVAVLALGSALVPKFA